VQLCNGNFRYSGTDRTRASAARPRLPSSFVAAKASSSTSSRFGSDRLHVLFGSRSRFQPHLGVPATVAILDFIPIIVFPSFSGLSMYY